MSESRIDLNKLRRDISELSATMLMLQLLISGNRCRPWRQEILEWPFWAAVALVGGGFGLFLLVGILGG